MDKNVNYNAESEDEWIKSCYMVQKKPYIIDKIILNILYCYLVYFFFVKRVAERNLTQSIIIIIRSPGVRRARFSYNVDERRTASRPVTRNKQQLPGSAVHRWQSKL